MPYSLRTAAGPRVYIRAAVKKKKRREDLFIAMEGSKQSQQQVAFNSTPDDSKVAAGECSIQARDNSINEYYSTRRDIGGSFAERTAALR